MNAYKTAVRPTQQHISFETKPPMLIRLGWKGIENSKTKRKELHDTKLSWHQLRKVMERYVSNPLCVERKKV